MSTGFVKYKRAEAEVAGRPSPNIWGDCPVSEINNNPAKGFHVFEDFLDLAAGNVTTVGGARFYSYLDTGSTLVLADDPKGAIELKTDATKDDSTTLISGNNTTGCILPADGVDKKWWFEVRVKANTISDDDIGWFLGLTQEGQAADSKPMADDTYAVNDIDHIGFNVKADDGDAVDFVYNLSGQTQIVNAGVKALVINEYVSLGFKYEPKDNMVRVFIDGVEKVSAAFALSVAAAPLDNLAVCLSMKAGDNAANTDKITIDWVRYAQEY